MTVISPTERERVLMEQLATERGRCSGCGAEKEAGTFKKG